MMKLFTLLNSFRVKIIITLVVVISFFSLGSFYIYNNYLTTIIYKNTEEDIKAILNFLQTQIIAARDGKVIRPLLKAESNNHCLIGSYVLDGNGKLVYSTIDTKTIVETMAFKEIVKQKDEIYVKTFSQGKIPFSRASIRFKNSPQCYSCHSPEVKTIGYVVVDYSLEKSHDTVKATRRFSILFTAALVVLILSFVMILHYRFIKRSLSQFKRIINQINKGELDKRISIPKSKELGELGHSFNQMVDQFQQTQVELQKYHEQELRNTQRLATIGEMSARLAHEIRNPMTGIANAIEIIIDETKNGHNKPILEEIRRQAGRVNKAVSNLLKFSQTKELNVQRENINEIIRSVVFFLENQALPKKMHFGMELDPQIPEFVFDASQMENVFLNLGINAVQASEARGTILYKTIYDREGGRVFITISDTGTGIPEDIIKEIFTPFYTTRTEGTGLGLAIVKDIIEMHNGEIKVENNPGKGCTFQIVLHTDWREKRN